MKKNILQVVGKMNRGGAETFLINILRNINRDKYQFYFLCFGDEKFDYQDEIELLGGKIIRLKKAQIPFKLIADIRKIIRDNKIHVVHTHTQLAGAYALLSGLLECTPKRVAHSHSTSAGKNGGATYCIYEFLSKKIISKAATDLVACGEEAGRYLFNGKSFKILNNGIDLDKFRFNSRKRANFRHDHGINKNDFILGMVGRLEKVKNHEFIIELFARYYRQSPDIKLVLAGQGSLKLNLEALVAKHGITKQVIFLGLVEDTASAYSAFDILAMPSIYEGLPVSLIEAQANNLPCLCSNNVDKKSNITDLVQFLPISEDHYELWKIAIDGQKKALRGGDQESIIKLRDGGYDIKNVVKDLKEIYGNFN